MKLALKILTIQAIIMILVPNIALAAMDCEKINDPKETKDYIISVLEEAVSGEDTRDQTNAESLSLICARESTCMDIEGKRTCGSKYTELSGCSTTEYTSCQRVQILLSQTGVGMLFGYIGMIYRWAASVIGIVSVVYLIYGGFLMATAGDNSGSVDKAKEKIIQSLGGLVLLFLSAVILYAINPNFFTL